MANEGYSILDVINDEYGVILTRNGCVSVAFRMYNPECYSLHRTDLEERNARLYQAFKHLPPAASCTSRTCSLKGSTFMSWKGTASSTRRNRGISPAVSIWNMTVF